MSEPWEEARDRIMQESGETRLAPLAREACKRIAALEAEKSDFAWRSVDDAMPSGGWTPRVLFAWVNTNGMTRVGAGSWIAARTVEAIGDMLEEDCDYDEDRDVYFIKEGWREWGWDEEYSGTPDGPVTHWMPMPRHPQAKEDDNHDRP